MPCAPVACRLPGPDAARGWGRPAPAQGVRSAAARSAVRSSTAARRNPQQPTAVPGAASSTQHLDRCAQPALRDHRACPGVIRGPSAAPGASRCQTLRCAQGDNLFDLSRPSSCLFPLPSCLARSSSCLARLSPFPAVILSNAKDLSGDRLRMSRPSAPCLPASRPATSSADPPLRPASRDARPFAALRVTTHLICLGRHPVCSHCHPVPPGCHPSRLSS